MKIRFIFVTIFLDALGIGLLIPVFPDVIRRFNSDQAFVSEYFGYFISVYALMQFFASPVLGSLSDKYGRRSILLLSLLGAGLDYIMMAYATNLTILFLGRMIAGLSGASFTVATSYMADISDDSNRSANFGMIGAGFGLGFIVGPALGGLVGHFSPQAPFLLAAALNLLNFVFGLFVLPESLPKHMRRQVEFKKLNPFVSLLKVLRPSPILILVIMFALWNLAGQSHPSIWTLYTQYKFGWSALDVGLSLSAVGLVIAVAQGWLTRIVIPKTGEQLATQFGIIFSIIGFIAYALSTQGWMMYAVLLTTAIANVGGPALQSMISKGTPAHEQGELQGSLVSMTSLCAIIGPVLYTRLFEQFTVASVGVQFAGAPYIAAAMFCSLALFLYWYKAPVKG